MIASIEEVRAQLADVCETLSWPLNMVLEHYKPDKYMRDQLEEDLPEWGERPFHEYLMQIKTPLDEGPDVMNGDMKPFNVFAVFSEFYGY